MLEKDDNTSPTRCINPAISVFYLLRKGNSVLHFASFLKSLREHRTEIRYKPVVIQKGFPAGYRHHLIDTWITEDGTRAQVVDVSDDGFDLLAYRKAAAQVETDYCLFFNSYSKILNHYWLDHYAKAIAKLGANSLVGATGSWQRPTLKESFPNVHIRSNAFAISRDLFLSLDHPLDRKEDCYMLEHGPRSMTNLVLEGGGSVAIIDLNGRILLPEQWADANIFWRGNQELLLISDNRTFEYQITNPRRRLRLSNAAWGKERCHVTAHSRIRRCAYVFNKKIKMIYAYVSLLYGLAIGSEAVLPRSRRWLEPKVKKINADLFG